MKGREHGRIMSVETKVRGDALAEDAAAGATTLIVGDAADFDEDGGWLTINDQVVEYLEADDDEGTITLAEGLDAAADEGDAVHVWSTLYDEAVDYQEALVELDGEYDNPEPVVAEVAEGVGDLPEGDRGVDGESCTLLRVSDDEWEVVGVGGRARKSKSIRFEADDVYALTAADITNGTATVSLSHRPIDESLKAWLNGLFQEPTGYSVNYDDQTVTWPLDGWELADDRIAVHYAYRKGLPRVVTPSYFSEVMADTPIAYWRLGDDTTTAADSSGNGRDGAYYNILDDLTGTLGAPSLLDGDPNKAIALDGIDDYMRVGHAAWMNVPTITLDAIIKLAAVGKVQNIIDRDGGATNRVFQFRVQSTNQLRLIFWTAAGGTAAHICDGATTLAANTRYHVAATFDGTIARLYLNGRLDGSLTVTTSTLASKTVDLSVGCWTAGENNAPSAQFLEGVIDEAAIYASALPIERIVAHADAVPV